MTERKGREGYHDPFAGIGGAAPARSALTLRIVLATFGLLACSAGTVALLGAQVPVIFPAVAALFAVVAVVDLAIVITRKRHGEPG
jgi:hypothetical protein